MSISNFLDETTKNQTWKNLWVNSINFANPEGTFSDLTLDHYEFYNHVTRWGGTLINDTVVDTSIKVTRIGSIVQIRLPIFTATGSNTAGFMRALTPLPERFQPAADIFFTCPWLVINGANVGTASNILVKIDQLGGINYLNGFGANFTANAGANGLPERICLSYTLI